MTSFHAKTAGRCPSHSGSLQSHPPQLVENFHLFLPVMFINGMLFLRRLCLCVPQLGQTHFRASLLVRGSRRPLVWRHRVHMQSVSQHRSGKRCKAFSAHRHGNSDVHQPNTDSDRRQRLFERDWHLRLEWKKRFLFPACTCSLPGCQSFSLPAIIHPAFFSATQWWRRLGDIPVEKPRRHPARRRLLHQHNVHTNAETKPQLGIVAESEPLSFPLFVLFLCSAHVETFYSCVLVAHF